ncbi:hypothetical protein C5167_011558 [Papaver somniferum]|uniref:Uncharacterized protein n=1 Tax=Papaver somniferum TaxID=3469 RepID=A0A4Y7K689_PAPSO|nr:hypothetical protein C5167_011558 [Papaver somniferum]
MTPRLCNSMLDYFGNWPHGKGIWEKSSKDFQRKKIDCRPGLNWGILNRSYCATLEFNLNRASRDDATIFYHRDNPVYPLVSRLREDKSEAVTTKYKDKAQGVVVECKRKYY